MWNEICENDWMIEFLFVLNEMKLKEGMLDFNYCLNLGKYMVLVYFLLLYMILYFVYLGIEVVMCIW